MCLPSLNPLITKVLPCFIILLANVGETIDRAGDTCPEEPPYTASPSK